MAGVYIHIPFCKKKCIYCNFYSVASGVHVDDFFQSLLKEMEFQKRYLEEEKIRTIYFGGGTPSLLYENQIAGIIENLRKHFDITEDAEITLEANPDDVSDKKLKEWKSASVNRLSIGVQSFNDTDLEYLKRIHNAQQADASVKRSQDAGFENISIDLIYGIPVQTESSWKENIEKAFSISVPHISAYALTLEEKTLLSKQILAKKVQAVDEEQSASHFRILMNEMKVQGFFHYEISNFCKDRFFSRHNTAYWKGLKYLGLGPSAHSYNGNSRQWNTANLNEYLKSISQNKIPFEKEILSQEQKLNEYIMTSLRTMWGCDLGHIESVFGYGERQRILSASKKIIDSNQMELKENILYLTDEGKLFADGIAAELFVVD